MNEDKWASFHFAHAASRLHSPRSTTHRAWAFYPKRSFLLAHARFSAGFRYFPRESRTIFFHLGTVLVIRRRPPAFLHQPLLDPIRPELLDLVRHDGFSPDSASKSSCALGLPNFARLLPEALVFFRIRSRTHPLAIGKFRKDSGGAFDLAQRGRVSE